MVDHPSENLVKRAIELKIMGKGQLNPIFCAIKKFLPLPFLAGSFFASVNLPSDPLRVPFLEYDPDGLKLLYTALSVAEAEMLSQMLIEAGFHIEFVPSTMTGVFGMTGNHLIYVHANELEKATGFLEEYLLPPVRQA